VLIFTLLLLLSLLPFSSTANSIKASAGERLEA
jgi:uncharacterized membrane protein